MESSRNPRVLIDEDPRASLLMIGSAIQMQMIHMIAQGHPLKDVVDPSKVRLFIDKLYELNGINLFTLLDGTPIGAIGFHKASLWWGKEGSNVLSEEFVVSLNDSYVGFGRIAVRRLEELAVKHDCSLIMSGNLLGNTPKQTENLYMNKAKFDFSYKHFIKVL